MDIDFSAVRKKAKEKYGPKSGEFQEDRIDFGKVRERAKEKYGTPVYDKQLGSQGHQPKDTETFSVGTAVPSGPSSPPTQPASTYAASSQGELQTPASIPYAPGRLAGFDKKPEPEPKKWKRGGPVSMGEAPEWLDMTAEEIGALHEQTVGERDELGEEIFQKTASSTVPTSAAASGQYTKPEENP